MAETIFRRARFWPWTATVAMSGGVDRETPFAVSLADVKELINLGICYFDSATPGGFSLFPHSPFENEGE